MVTVRDFDGSATLVATMVAVTPALGALYVVVVPWPDEIEPELAPLVSAQLARLSANGGVMVARTTVSELALMVEASAAAEIATATTFIEIVAFFVGSAALVAVTM